MKDISKSITQCNSCSHAWCGTGIVPIYIVTHCVYQATSILVLYTCLAVQLAILSIYNNTYKSILQLGVFYQKSCLDLISENLFSKFCWGACPRPPRVRHAKACLAILHTAARLSVLLCPTTNGELQPPLTQGVEIQLYILCYPRVVT